MNERAKKYIGDRNFYRMLLAIAVPIMIQNGFTNFVSMLDNIMVGRLGTEQMSGVAIANQLVFIYNLCIFGGLSGAGIFTAQFYGKNDNEGIRHTFRFKLILATILTVVAIIVLSAFGEQLIGIYLHSSEDGGDLAFALKSGMDYMEVVFLGMFPFMLVQVYSSTLRECGETVLPMKAGVAAVFVNLIFNYLLIYGKFGFPYMGVRGAAVATVISRFVEAGIVLVWTHCHKAENPYIEGLYRSLKVPKQLCLNITTKGLPLLLNEALWSSGMALLVQCYSMRGLNAVAGVNIAETLNNVFKVVFLAFGSSVGIIIGRLLGAGRMEEAKDTDRKIIVFSIFISAILGVFMAAISGVFPKIYNTNDAARHIATILILAQAVCLPLNAFKNATYIHHIPVRRRFCVGREPSNCIHTEPFHKCQRPLDLHWRADRRIPKGFHWLCPCQKGRLDKEHRHGVALGVALKKEKQHVYYVFNHSVRYVGRSHGPSHRSSFENEEEQ